jgi:predicted metal-dependent hydrolase
MKQIPYKLVRSNRKSLALSINSEAQLVVRAPMKMDEMLIHNFIQKKSSWITEKQRQEAVFGLKQSPFLLKDCENILYLGNSYTILFKDIPEINLNEKHIFIPKGMSIKDFKKWMRKQASDIITERVNYYASLMGVKYTSVKMSEAKRRWGSCGSKNGLNFAWRLIMCPLSIIDYVAVHELSHITYKNHSPMFWSRVATVLPNYNEAQDWLRLNRRLLEVI